MKILILGANGFIGRHLSEAILAETPHHIFAIDIVDHHLKSCQKHPRFHFFLGDMTVEKKWIEQHIEMSDVVVPLAAIAVPGSYVKDPVRIFELDFEANLEIVRLVLRFNKRLIFPSTSEVYGMCHDMPFHEETSLWVTGPIHKQRWIYANCKQLLDRLIYAYGQQHGFSYTLFRPFNWYGPGLDDLTNATPASSRVLAQFIGHGLRGENIILVDGGLQKRCFTYIDDGTHALLKIIENKKNCAFQKVFNIGNPSAERSVRELAEELLGIIKQFRGFHEIASRCQLVSVEAKNYYGEGYQDVSRRVPSIEQAEKYLHWRPKVSLEEGLRKTVEYYLRGEAIAT